MSRVVRRLLDQSNGLRPSGDRGLHGARPQRTEFLEKLLPGPGACQSMWSLHAELAIEVPEHARE